MLLCNMTVQQLAWYKEHQMWSQRAQSVHTHFHQALGKGMEPLQPLMSEVMTKGMGTAFQGLHERCR